MGQPLTETAIAKLRKQARQHAREKQIPYSQALELAAQAAGFDSWHQVQQHRPAAAGPAADLELPLDPVLPRDFDDTPNEDRPAAQLDRWWLKPFGQTLPDGRIDVRCLDGGAWDRSTYYGTAANLEEARRLAREKLQQWQSFRDEPTASYLRSEPPFLFTLEPNRPGMPRPVVGTGDAAQLAALKDAWARDPQLAASAIRRARDRSERVPSVDEIDVVMRPGARLAVHRPDGSPASFAEVAVLLYVYRMAEPGELTPHFTATELALQLSDLVPPERVSDLLTSAAQLRIGPHPALVSLMNDGAGTWIASLSCGWGRKITKRAPAA